MHVCDRCVCVCACMLVWVLVWECVHVPFCMYSDFIFLPVKILVHFHPKTFFVSNETESKQVGCVLKAHRHILGSKSRFQNGSHLLGFHVPLQVKVLAQNSRYVTLVPFLVCIQPACMDFSVLPQEKVFDLKIF